MSLEKTQEACKKLSKMSTDKLLDPNALFEYLNKYIEGLRKNGGEDLVPHLILSHGFMQWGYLLGSQFPCLRWRGQNIEKLSHDDFERFLYVRFFLRIAELPSLQDMTEKEKDELKEKGWQAYLED